jgi:hypothetical protein
MRTIIMCVGVCCALVVCAISGCQHEKNSYTTPMVVERLPHLQKGYELYSWKINKQWYFTLITATNRMKTNKEITDVKNSINKGGWIKITTPNVLFLKTVLEKLPPKETVVWLGKRGDYYFSLPSSQDVDDVKKFATEKKIKLEVPEK